MSVLHRLALLAGMLPLSACALYPGLDSWFPGMAGSGASPQYPGAPPPGYDRRAARAESQYYLKHPVEREAELMQCQQNPAVTQDPNCLAAIQADRQQDSLDQTRSQFGGGFGMFGPIVTPELK